MPVIASTDAALAAVAAGWHIVHLSDRERMVAHLPPSQVLLAETAERAAQLKRTYAIRVEHERDRRP